MGESTSVHLQRGFNHRYNTGQPPSCVGDRTSKPAHLSHHRPPRTMKRPHEWLRGIAPAPRRHHQGGASLIEVLVTVLILALGLLGMAGLMVNALKMNQSSLARSQAVVLSHYILEAMRADRDGAIAGHYNTTGTGLCEAQAITGTSLADHTRRHWIESLHAGLTDDHHTCAAIACDGTGACTVTIRWRDPPATGPDDLRFVTGGRL